MPSGFFVAPSRAGGWTGGPRGPPRPAVSRHDTEEEARQKAAAYARGAAIAAGELLDLRDGSRVLIRPVMASDKPLFVAGFERFGEDSRYRRFLAPKKALSEPELALFTEIDHHGHEALGAIDVQNGQGVWGARLTRY